MTAWITAAEVVELLEKLKVDLIDWTDGDTYPLIDEFILQKQRLFQNATRRNIEEVTRTTRHDGTGKDLLVAPDYPIKDGSVTINIYGISPVSYAPSDLDVDNDTGIIYLESVTKAAGELIFPHGRRNIEITATYGFSTIPDDVKDAIKYWVCLEVMMMEDKRTTGGDLSPSVKRFRIGNYSESYGDGGRFSVTVKTFESTVQSIINQYYRTTGVRL